MEIEQLYQAPCGRDDYLRGLVVVTRMTSLPGSQLLYRVSRRQERRRCGPVATHLASRLLEDYLLD